jgi:hypothetical protein
MYSVLRSEEGMRTDRSGDACAEWIRASLAYCAEEEPNRPCSGIDVPGRATDPAFDQPPRPFRVTRQHLLTDMLYRR